MTLLCDGCGGFTNTAFVPLNERIYSPPEGRPEIGGRGRSCAARIVESRDGTAKVERGCGYDQAPAFMRAFADSAIAEQPYSAEAIAERERKIREICRTP